jgi:hypothetical protein
LLIVERSGLPRFFGEILAEGGIIGYSLFEKKNTKKGRRIIFGLFVFTQ